MKQSSGLSAIVLGALLAAGCGGGSSSDGQAANNPPVQTVTCTDRAELCADELLAGSSAKLVDNRFFMPAAGAGPARHTLMGTLNVSPTALRLSQPDADGRTTLPGFSVGFMTVGDRLLPLERHIIHGGADDRFGVILSPGRVWSEPADQGMSRASLPFTLVTDQWNEAHNGLATFLFDDATVTDLRIQVSQETATWNKFDMWAVAVMSYAPAVIAGADEIADAFRAELAGRVDARPWSELEQQVGALALAPFLRNIDPAEVSAAGILIDDTLYYIDSASRTGEYPYPLEMRHGVFSVTKSAGAALTLLRLAEKYGDHVFDLFVTDYLDVTANHDGWNGVTFGHLLSMTPGIGDNAPDAGVSQTFADENDQRSATWNNLWDARTRRAKLHFAFQYGNYPWEPGTIVRYNTAMTFVLGAAMDSFYKSMEGADASVWEMMKDEVFEPIGLGAMPMLQTSDADPLPIYGFGLFLNAYDTARIMQLLHNDGVWNGMQILHRERTRQSLYTDGGQGLPTSSNAVIEGGLVQAIQYLNSFWSFELTDGFGCSRRIPFMNGFGGNYVLLLPNGVGAYRYADADVFDGAALALAARAVRPLCPQ